MKPPYRFILAAILATAAALTAHICIQKYTLGITAAMSVGHVFPNPGDHPGIVFWAYVTAFEQCLVTALVYYFVGEVVEFASRFIKILVLTALLLELHGQLIRQTFMNSLMAHMAAVAHPLLYGVASQLDQWVAELLLVSILVLLCPTKKYSKS